VQQHQCLGTLVGLHLQQLDPALQPDQAQQSDGQDDHGDEHLDQGRAVLHSGGFYDT
jgi:hypothetical protein